MREKIGIIGLGLLGTSLSMALADTEYETLVWTRKPEVRRWAGGNSIADIVCNEPEQVFGNADIVILCVPIPCIIDFIGRYSRLMKPSAILTDIGSVKGPIENAAKKNPGLRFIGSHPMAGTEKTGPYNAFKTLYEKADVFVVPPAEADEQDVCRIEKFWRAIGTRTFRIDSEKHDILVAHTSHVPHVLACSLVLSVLDCAGQTEMKNRFAGCATGFRDTSRIASSSAQMWREIIEQNTPAVLEAMKSFRDCFDRLEDQFRRRDFDAFEKEFAKGAELRNLWMKYKNY